MAPQVFTARISSRDPDRLDITRKSGTDFGKVFAPSWAILGPALDARGRGETEAHWPIYERAYLAEMRASYRRNRDAWAHLLGKPRVVLVCYCTDAERCHRMLLGRDILPKLGATFAGEVPRG